MRMRYINASASAAGTSLPGRGVADVDDSIKVEVDQYESGGRLKVDEKGNPIKKVYTLPEWLIATRQAIEVSPKTPLAIRITREEDMEIEGRGQEEAIRSAQEQAVAANRRVK